MLIFSRRAVRANFKFKQQKVGGWPQNMSAPGRYSWLRRRTAFFVEIKRWWWRRWWWCWFQFSACSASVCWQKVRRDEPACWSISSSCSPIRQTSSSTAPWAHSSARHFAACSPQSAVADARSTTETPPPPHQLQRLQAMATAGRCSWFRWTTQPPAPSSDM